MRLVLIILVVLTGFNQSDVEFYPIDGYASTGIRRLAYLEDVKSGAIKNVTLLPGALKSMSEIRLNLTGDKGAEIKGIPETDPELQKAVNGLFSGLNPNYSVAVLDITENRQPRYAERKGSVGYQPGSVAKIIVATAFFHELSNLYPHSFTKRQELLRGKIIKGGQWAMVDEHTVPFYNPETRKLIKRTVQPTDEFSLYEWLDHMLSVSNNGAASVVWREAILMRVFKQDYPELTFEDSEAYFKQTPKTALSDLAIEVANTPLRDLGITEEEWRVGRLFTRGAGTYIPGKGGSIGTPVGLMKYLIALEKGLVVDEASSLEIKRLLYMTDRRIRYASSPALATAAVYFKSGSLYKCTPEEGYQCGKYLGNVDNFMNSVAIVEHADSTTYLVCLMSNVRKKNSASDHHALASSIDRIIRR
ncbi:MAG: hypothetical protein DHS20C17_23770 [Cyclobacteriaceae bacterium]|nr:MAG: hypothetical protein DHS20C17_23770 [Cyclobacteriaceae bacterium]